MSRLDDIATAKTLCDYFLDKRVYGQGIDTNNEDGLALYQRGSMVSRNLTVTNRLLRQDNPQYWYNIGEKNRKQPTGSGLWCDGSAGMILSLLGPRAEFKSSLEVVKQGEPTLHGHWWVIANRPSTAALDFDQELHRDCFVIDLWGAIRGKKASSVGYNPPYVFYDCRGEGHTGDEQNALVIVCRVAPK